MKFEFRSNFGILQAITTILLIALMPRPLLAQGLFGFGMYGGASGLCPYDIDFGTEAYSIQDEIDSLQKDLKEDREKMVQVGCLLSVTATVQE